MQIMTHNHSTFALKSASKMDGDDVRTLLASIPSENGFTNAAYGISREDFPAWLETTVNHAAGIGLPEGYVPSTTYFLYVNGEPVGMIRLRTQLSESLRILGGHIGYAVGPAFRGKGYATKMLRLVLQEANAIGIEQALVTANVDNLASRRVIEKNGGVLEDIIENTCRYWVPTDV